MTRLSSLVLFVGDVEAAGHFYRSIGVPLELEDHGDGPVHLAAELAGVHVALYPAAGPGRAPARRAAGASFAGVYVADLDEALQAVVELGAPVLSGHEVMPWGCRFVAEDPDGRAVEVNDEDHCAGPG